MKQIPFIFGAVHLFNNVWYNAPNMKTANLNMDKFEALISMMMGMMDMYSRTLARLALP